MTLHEPSTFWTDLAFGGWSGALWLQLLGNRAAERARGAGWWRHALAAAAVAALLGAFSHGFGPELPEALDWSLWRLTLLAVAASGFCLMQAAALTAVGGVPLRAARTVSAIVTVALALWAIESGEFVTVICVYGVGLLCVLAAAIARRRDLPAAHLRSVAAGVVMSVVAAVIQQGRLGLWSFLNYNDVYHIVQAVAVGCLWLGARRLSPGGQNAGEHR
jgi:hypothetical protein